MRDVLSPPVPGLSSNLRWELVSEDGLAVKCRSCLLQEGVWSRCYIRRSSAHGALSVSFVDAAAERLAGVHLEVIFSCPRGIAHRPGRCALVIPIFSSSIHLQSARRQVPLRKPLAACFVFAVVVTVFVLCIQLFVRIQEHS